MYVMYASFIHNGNQSMLNLSVVDRLSYSYDPISNVTNVTNNKR